jgi:hypothetical protein
MSDLLRILVCACSDPQNRYALLGDMRCKNAVLLTARTGECQLPAGAEPRHGQFAIAPGQHT